MKRERDCYVRVKLSCPSCFSLHYCRVLARRESATLCVACETCKQDMVAAIIPDEKMDGAKQEKGLWIVPLYDLIMIESRLTEHEGDRLLWGLGNVLESNINRFLQEEKKCS